MPTVVKTAKKVLLKDIAERAGVSTALVSFVLSGNSHKHRVNEQTAKNINLIAKEMHYTPNMAAKTLRDGKTRVIGAILSDISNPFFAHIARGVEDVAVKYGYTVFFGSSDEKAEKLELLVRGLLNRGVDGLIIVPCENSEAILDELIRNNVPLVLFDRPVKNLQVSHISLNNLSAGYTATRHLIRSGYKKVGMIAYDIALTHMQERLEGYRTAMTDNGLASNINIGYIDAQNPRKSAEKVLRKMLNNGTDALFFATNTISSACMYYINTIKPNIPSELGIVGFDGGDAFELFSSPLSYIKQPVEIFSQKAVEVLVEKMTNDNSSVQHITIDGELIIRKSSIK